LTEGYTRVVVNSDFYGDWIDSYVDGSKMRYFPRQKRRRRLHRSAGVVISLITLVLGIVVSIYIIRFTISDKVGKIGAQVLASVANAVQIQVLNHVYSSMAIHYTEKENHRYVFLPVLTCIVSWTHRVFQFLFCRTDTQVLTA
jgi:hypothetical protein